MTLLEQINSPADLRKLSPQQLSTVALELRSFLLDSVSRSGGHLASGLGVVELTVALHYVFQTPDDRLVWDVGHQCYPHKILTGRKAAMASIRQEDGLAGFARRDESEYDAFGAGHSSTSISAALGMAIAARRKGEKRNAVAVIGDGAMTAGMAFEALNHAGDLGENLLVVLNDNDMSISPNVGGLSNYMGRVLSSRLYVTMREGGKQLLKPLPPMQELAKRAEEHMKGMVVPGTLFEELGFHYYGPIDGHDVDLLVKTLKNIQSIPGPKLLHVITRKGKGYERAEEEPIRYHGVSQFDPDKGIQEKSAGGKTYTGVFSDWLCDQAATDERLVGITPAMREGSGLVEFSKRFPDRYFDVAIAEQHALTLAAGMACDGLKPVVAIYSTFLQRAYDQLIHDIALQNLPVLLAIDRAGLVGPDGPTHAGSFDLSFLRCIPNMTIMAPVDEAECRQMLSTGFTLDGPAAVRYPRGTGPGVETGNDLNTLPVGKGEIIRQGKGCALLVFGSPLAESLKAAEEINATVVNMRFIKPLDTALIESLAATHEKLVTIEDNAIAGGAGSAVNEYLNTKSIDIDTMNLGLPDYFQEHGVRESLLAKAGLDATGILKSIATSRDCNLPRPSIVS